jgi:hypothetical protein
MKHKIDADDFFSLILDAIWFRETVDYYFKGKYKAKYRETLETLCNKGAVEFSGNTLYTTVKP